MYWFLIPLIIGFASNLVSAFTAEFSRRWGKTNGSLITIILRDITGIPVWAIGFVLAIGESSQLFYRVTDIHRIAGWAVISVGGIIIIVALMSIRRKAAAPTTADTLVSHGIYSRIRHPIHSGTLLEFAGLFIIWPSLQVCIACITGIIWIFLQSRFEESDLLKRIPGYKEYREKVPAFIPFIR